MAVISIDVGELADRLPGLPAWTQPGDEVVITWNGMAVYRLVPTGNRPAWWGMTTTAGPALDPMRPYTEQVPPAVRTTPRPVGTHLGHTTLSPDFHDTCDWDGTPLPKVGT
jgi:antitoxin (DNA-binding transcriptional repressor) of toxin-antitoxin stability system